MTKIILLRVLLFLVPFVLYWLYWRLLKRRHDKGKPTYPVAVLAICGLVLVAASFLVLRATEGEGTESTYVPPKYEDGKIVPAQNIPKE